MSKNYEERQNNGKLIMGVQITAKRCKAEEIFPITEERPPFSKDLRILKFKHTHISDFNEK